MTKTRWQDLIVTDSDGNNCGTLEHVGERWNADIMAIKLNADGSLAEWTGYYIAAPGETPDWNTPQQPVDWTGFADAITA